MRIVSAKTKTAQKNILNAYTKMSDSVVRLFSLYPQLVDKLQKWVRANKSSIYKTYLCLGDIYWKFVVVQNKVQFDGELMDKMSDFDIELARDLVFKDMDCDTIVIPKVTNKDALAAFVYGNFIVEIK